MERPLYMLSQLIGNPDHALILLLVFVGTVGAVSAVFWFFWRRSTAADRLQGLTANLGGSVLRPHLLEREDTSWVARVTRPLITAPKDGRGRTPDSLRVRLIQAGFRSKTAYGTFVFLRLLLAILLPSLFLLQNLFFNLTPRLVSICLALATIGYFAPAFILNQLREERQQRLQRALPDALDLMVVCVEAGLGLDMTFKRVGDEIQSLSQDLSDEFYLTVREIRAGRNREECFRNMAVRTGVAEVGNLMTVLNQTNRFGTSLAKALRVHADSLRVKRRQIAEERAAKASVKLVFPLVVFVFPAMFIVLAGPAVIRIFKVLLPALLH